MNDFQFGSLGEAWVHLVERIVQDGERMGDEGFELLALQTSFPATVEGDLLLKQFADSQLIAEMEKVFFASGANALGHSYAGLMRGPVGQGGLEGVISLLQAEPLSKRAVLTLVPPGDGKVPCLNVIQFLVRNHALQALYFARAQDIFKKFYADALCVARMARRVADELSLPAAMVTGFIGSGHIYDADLPAGRRLLTEAQAWLPAPKGGD